MDKRGHIIDQKDLFWDQIFWDQDWDIFLRLNFWRPRQRLFQNQIFWADTETFFLNMKSDSGFGNVSRSILRPIIFKTAIETLCETKSFQSVTCISLENDISTAKTLRKIDCPLTFYLEICETPILFSRLLQRHFWDPNFRDRNFF